MKRALFSPLPPEDCAARLIWRLHDASGPKQPELDELVGTVSQGRFEMRRCFHHPSFTSRAPGIWDFPGAFGVAIAHGVLMPSGAGTRIELRFSVPREVWVAAIAAAVPSLFLLTAVAIGSRHDAGLSMVHIVTLLLVAVFLIAGFGFVGLSHLRSIADAELLTACCAEATHAWPEDMLLVEPSYGAAPSDVPPPRVMASEVEVDMDALVVAEELQMRDASPSRREL